MNFVKINRSPAFKFFVQLKIKTVPICLKIQHDRQPSGESQQKITKFLKPEKIIIHHTKDSFKAALVHIAVDNAISLQFFSSESFRALVGEMAQKLQEMILESF
jgi:hypothetical protein